MTILPLIIGLTLLFAAAYVSAEQERKQVLTEAKRVQREAEREAKRQPYISSEDYECAIREEYLRLCLERDLKANGLTPELAEHLKVLQEKSRQRDDLDPSFADEATYFAQLQLEEETAPRVRYEPLAIEPPMSAAAKIEELFNEVVLGLLIVTALGMFVG
jgi:hypothetical protein